MSTVLKPQTCPFCAIKETESRFMTNQLLAFPDKYPVTKGHHLIIPRQHRTDYFDLSPEELSELPNMLTQLKLALQQEYPTIDGFNIGMNCGQTAGQTIFHCHIHLIPRRAGDIANPEGGVRGVIPEKQQYQPL